MIPEGYMRDQRGALVPEGKVRPEHKLEDELTRRLLEDARRISATLADFKAYAMGEAQAFRQVVAERYGAAKGGAKGNVTFRSFDGTLEMQVAVSDSLTFGPELQVAKELIDECVRRWSEGANDNLQALVNDAFQVNQAGRIDTGRVLGLRRLEIDDPEWQRAMGAISDAVRTVSSKTYLRFYERDPDTGARRAIPARRGGRVMGASYDDGRRVEWLDHVEVTEDGVRTAAVVSSLGPAPSDLTVVREEKLRPRPGGPLWRIKRLRVPLAGAVLLRRGKC